MSWIENLLIVAGASFDIFAAMECQGSLVRKVNKRQLTLISLIVALWQLAAVYFGYFLSDMICRKNPVSDEALLGEIIAVVIFFCLGIRLMVKAIKNEYLVEHLESRLELKRFLKMTAATSIYTLLSGIAFGFLSTQLVPILLMMVLFSVLFVVAGMYTGYHFGFEQKTKAYVVGAILLWVAGIDVIVRCVL
ncbi:MAG: manganese efflux pump [Agathobacter sp.]|nr:manganese efflux pump [Agathobacter sp.]